MVWLELLTCILVIVFAGTKLSKYGDEIADLSGLGRSWIGLILLATVTSLPELISGVSAVTINKLPDIAVGGVIGSCLFNLVILAALDVAAGKTPLSSRVHHSHIISAGFGIMLLGFVCLAKIFGGIGTNIFGWIDPFSFAYIGIYILAMRTIFLFESKRAKETIVESTTEAARSGKLAKPIAMFVVFSALIVVAALYLPDVADRIGKATGLSNTFIGSSLVAITTSLPELVVSLAAARIGAFDMAVGNVLGSNLFNVAILAIEDFCYMPGSLLAHASMQHLMSALAAIIATAIAAVGVTFRAEKKLLALTWDSIAIVMCYLAASYWLFAHS
jgi:cation:H+ antiporter